MQTFIGVKLDQIKFLYALLDSLEEIKDDLEYDYGSDDVALSKIKNLIDTVYEYKEEMDG